LPKGIKLSDGVIKFNEQQDPRIWLDDFMTAVTIGGGSRDNALQLLSLHLKDNARAWLNNLAPDSIRSWEEFRKPLLPTFEVPRDGPCCSKSYACACKGPEKTSGHTSHDGSVSATRRRIFRPKEPSMPFGTGSFDGTSRKS
jgi:hypothetical protein